MVIVAQLVRALDCGSKGRGFETPHSPQNANPQVNSWGFFVLFGYISIMRFETIFPCKTLRPYIKHFAISENQEAAMYKVYPSTGLVIGFQYSGSLSLTENNNTKSLDRSGITGIGDSYRIFNNAPFTGSVLVYFTEVGFSHFCSVPAHGLFNQSVSLVHLFCRQDIARLEESLYLAANDNARIAVVEQFFLSRLIPVKPDLLVAEAVRRLYASRGSLRISELAGQRCISQSPLEKRFRRVVGTSPKKFASIVRFNNVLTQMGNAENWAQLGYDNGYFDQSHFIHDFKRYTGTTPEKFES